MIRGQRAISFPDWTQGGVKLSEPPREELLPWWNPDGATPGGVGGIWAYQPQGAASFAASLVDVSGNGNNAIDPGGLNTPGWDAVNGWKFTDLVSPHYLKTTFFPQNDQSQSVLIQFANVTGGRYLFGVRNLGGYLFNILDDVGLATVIYQNGGILNAPPALVNGNLAIAGGSGYRDGLPDGVIVPNVLASLLPCFIGCRNQAGAPNNPILAHIKALVIYDTALTAPQMLSRATAMAAL
jgi:hypothetical protein